MSFCINTPLLSPPSFRCISEIRQLQNTRMKLRFLNVICSLWFVFKLLYKTSPLISLSSSFATLWWKRFWISYTEYVLAFLELIMFNIEFFHYFVQTLHFCVGLVYLRVIYTNAIYRSITDLQSKNSWYIGYLKSMQSDHTLWIALQENLTDMFVSQITYLQLLQTSEILRRSSLPEEVFSY